MESYVQLFHVIDRLGSIKGNKTLQKIIYLIQSANFNLGYRYEWGITGPVSPKLENDIYEAVSLGIINRKWVDGFPLYSCNYNIKSGYVMSKLNSTYLPDEIDRRLMKIITLVTQGEMDLHDLEIVASLDYLSNSKRCTIEEAVKTLLDTGYELSEFDYAQNNLTKITA